MKYRKMCSLKISNNTTSDINKERMSGIGVGEGHTCPSTSEVEAEDSGVKGQGNKSEISRGKIRHCFKKHKQNERMNWDKETREGK